MSLCWSSDQLADFERRRSHHGTRTSAAVRTQRAGPTSRPQRSELSERELHLAVGRHLRHRAATGVFWFHPANGEHRYLVTAAKLKAFGVKPSTPDLVLLFRGKLHALQLKRQNGQLSLASNGLATPRSKALAFSVPPLGR